MLYYAEDNDVIITTTMIIMMTTTSTMMVICWYDADNDDSVYDDGSKGASGNYEYAPLQVCVATIDIFLCVY